MFGRMLKDGYDLSVDTICRISRGLRKDGRIVAFTHGAFDLFHYGHLYLLEKTAARCDFLVVGIESDRNISNYKSVSRPIINESERLDIICSLRCVGSAFIYQGNVDDDEYEELYKQLNPHFISIGRKFGFKDKIVERSEMLGIGLEQFWAQDLSTTKVIERIIKRYYTKNFAEGSKVLIPEDDRAVY